MKIFLAFKTSMAGLLLGLFVTALFSSPLLAVDCSPTDITLISQADVDDFQDNHGPCDRIVGGLTINGDGIENVNGLSGLIAMGNLRFLSTTDLANVDGLSNLANVDDSLFFTDCDSLTNVDGLSKLTSVGGDVRFSFMEALTNLNGLSALSTAGGILLEFNTALLNVDGLSSIQSVDTSIGMESNIALLNLDGFSNLTTVGGTFTLFGHSLLTNIEGLSSLISVGKDFRMESNPLLAHCRSLVPLLDNKDHGDSGPGPGTSGVPDVGDTVVIGDNLPGCNSIVEIINPIFGNSFERPKNMIIVFDDPNNNIGFFSSIAIGTDGYPVIGYKDETAGSLMVMKCHDPACAGGNETISIVDEPAGNVYFPAIAVGPDGFPVIGYKSGTALKVAKCNDTACAGGDEIITTLDNSDIGLGSYLSLAIGTDGFPVFSYYDDDADQLRVAKCNDLACAGEDETITVVDSVIFSGIYTSIAIGTDDFPVISYGNKIGDLKVAKCNDTACSAGDELISVVDAPDGELVGQYNSIAIGADGFPIISYHHQRVGTLKVAKCNDNACTGGDELISVVDDPDHFAGLSSSIAIAGDDLPVISYFAYTSFSDVFLKVAKCNDQACTGGDEIINVVDDPPENIVGATSSIAIGSDGLPIVSYQDVTAQTLKILHCGTGECIP